MKKISKVATASVLLFTLANPLAVFAENRVDNVSEASSNKTTQDLTISSEEINGDIVFYVTAVRDTYEAILYAKINGKNYTYNLGNLKKGQVSKIVQPGASINNNSASITKESKKEKSLPNTSVVRELVEKSISYSNELNGNEIEAKVVYKVYELVEKNPTLNEGTKYVSESKVKEGAIVKPEVLVKPEYKEVLGGAIVEPAVQPELPKAEEPATPAPKVEEPTTPAPKAEEPAALAPKAEEPAAPAPKAEEPAAPAPKVEEPAAPAPKAEKPAVPAPKVEEPAAPAPKAEEPAVPAPKVEEPAAPAPKAEEPAAPASKVEEPAAPAPKAEESSAPKVGEPVAPAPKVEEPAAPKPKVEEPATPAPKVGEPVAPAPKVEEPAAPAPKAEESSAPKVGEPVAPAPKVEEPAAPKPKVEEPATPAPKAEEPAAPAPKVEEPAVPAPKAEEPAAPAPKAEEPAAPAPKVEEPAAPAPKVEEPAAPTPKAEELAAPAPKVEEPATPAPKAEELAAPAPKVEEPAAPKPKVEEPATPAPKAEEPATPTPKAEEPAAPAPKAEEPAAPAPKAEEPAVPAPKAEEPAAPAPKAEEPAAPAPKVEEPAAPAPKVEEPAAPTPKAEEPAAPAPKAEEPAAPKEDTPSEEVTPKDEKLEEAKKDGKDVIEKIAASKLSEIEKIKDEAEKAKLEAKLKELKEAGLEAINNAKDHDAAVDAADEYQTKIDEINVPGEELPAPNYNKDNLTNGRNEGTTIDNGSTTIGHGAGEATSTTPTKSATEERPTSPVTPTQPASTSEGTSSFRNAPEVQVRARRVAREANQPDGTVNISYNYDGMPDINGFLSDPGENNTVAISNSATEDEVKELVKAKIQAKAQELAKHGYKVKEEIVFEQDTSVKNFNYVVTFTKEKVGTSSFRNAPAVQVRTKKVVKRDLSNKTKKINIYYNLTALKDIAGALGEVEGENMLTFPGGTSKDDLKRAIEEKTKAQIEKLNKQGFKVVSTTDLDQIVEGGDSYDYVVEFTKESKSTSVNNTGFRKAPLVQKRAKRSVEQKETVDVNVYFNLKTLPGIAGALDVDGDNTIKLPKDASKEQVKEAIKEKIAKVEKRGYKVSDFYFGAKTEHGYDFVVEFKK